jgi:membrane-associated phospholipid phosphatase
VVVADQVSAGLLKPLFDRPRPFKVLEDVHQLVGAHAGSFPSSHAANTFAAGVFLALRFRRMRPILVVPVVVSWSRVYVGVHYPLDVAAGAVLGAAIGAGFAALDRIARLRIGWLRRRIGADVPAGEVEEGPPGDEPPSD